MKKDNNYSGSSGFEEKPSRLPKSEIKYYYSREERLKKLRRGYTSQTPRFFRRKRSRILLILLVDIFLISIVAYLINKPANLYVTKKAEDLQYELNVTGIRGKKVIVGFSLKNLGANPYHFENSGKVILKILKKDGTMISKEKSFSPETELQPGESTSVIFIFSQDELPASGKLVIYYRDYNSPIFSRSVRF